MIELLLWGFLFIIGYFLIFFAADVFLDNLKELCIIYNISPFIIGLFILGIDPEESIASIIAATNGLTYIAVGNVIGNSIVALTIPFAIPLFFYKIDFNSVSQFYFNLIYFSMILILGGVCFYFGLLLAGLFSLFIYLFYLIRNIRSISKEDLDRSLITEDSKKIQLETQEEEKNSKFKKFILVFIGLIFIILGGELLIISAKNIIVITKIPETFFGFVVIALVTNVEEITLILKSIRKRSVEIGLGGMIGKLIWNLTITFGISGIIAMNVSFTWITLYNWLILLFLIIYFNFISRKKNLGKRQGITLTLFFILFISINFFTII